MADKIEQEFISLDDISGGELYLGLAESFQIRYLARVIKDFKTRNPNLHYHITSGDTEQIADKLDKGLLDFLVLAELPDSRKYEYLSFPEKDVGGLVIPEGDPLSEKEVIQIEDLEEIPLFCSEQAWNGDLKKWFGSSFSKMKLEGSFRLSYNGSIFAREGLGYLLTFRHLIDTSKESGLIFRPLEPALETTLYIAWNRYQTFTSIAERFLQQLKDSFGDAGKTDLIYYTKGLASAGDPKIRCRCFTLPPFSSVTESLPVSPGSPWRFPRFHPASPACRQCPHRRCCRWNLPSWPSGSGCWWRS